MKRALARGVPTRDTCWRLEAPRGPREADESKIISPTWSGTTPDEISDRVVLVLLVASYGYENGPVRAAAARNIGARSASAEVSPPHFMLFVPRDGNVVHRSSVQP